MFAYLWPFNTAFAAVLLEVCIRRDAKNKPFICTHVQCRGYTYMADGI